MLFSRYLGIDYSGAETAESSLPGIRVYEASAHFLPREIHPPASPRKYWTRRGLAQWLGEQLLDGPPTLVGIDHGFSFPEVYFKQNGLPEDWQAFLEDFQAHWPTDAPNTYVDFVRDGVVGRGGLRTGDPRWRRVTEKCSKGAKSVFHFDVQGSVAKSTHAGLPWLLYLRKKLEGGVHFWPFDGWKPAPATSVVAEVYPALWGKAFEKEERNSHQHDAYSVARWMRETDGAGKLSAEFRPALPAECNSVALFEGWILGQAWKP
jgi:hypothetical protein